MPTRNQNYKSDLLADLRKDPSYAATYISAAYSDSQEAFLVALRDVAEARIGMANVAKEARVNRENLYRTLSRDGNPRLSTLGSVLNALGLQLEVRPSGDSNAPQGSPSPTSGQILSSKTIVVGSTGIGIISQAKTSTTADYLATEIEPQTNSSAMAHMPPAKLQGNQFAQIAA